MLSNCDKKPVSENILLASSPEEGRMNRKVLAVALCFVALVAGGCQQQSAQSTTSAAATVAPAKDTDVTGKTVAAANAFLATLDDAGRAKVSFPFNSEDKRKRWSNFPV